MQLSWKNLAVLEINLNWWWFQHKISKNKRKDLFNVIFCKFYGDIRICFLSKENLMNARCFQSWVLSVIPALLPRQVWKLTHFFFSSSRSWAWLSASFCAFIFSAISRSLFFTNLLRYSSDLSHNYSLLQNNKISLKQKIYRAIYKAAMYFPSTLIFRLCWSRLNGWFTKQQTYEASGVSSQNTLC